ncbi:unnamed protein product [Alopecurus aequalis]
MDDGGYVEAQRGPIREPVPLTWIRAAGWCLLVSMNIVPVGTGIGLPFIRALDPNGVPYHGVLFPSACGLFLIVSGLTLATWAVRILVARCRESREIETMTRLHVVSVSRL